MSEHWEFFPCRIGDGVGSVVYDHGLSKTIDGLALRQSVRLFLRFKTPDDDGMPNEAEEEVAGKLEGRIESIVLNHSGVYTGRFTYEGTRIFYTYVDLDEGQLKTLAADLSEEFGYTVKFDTRDDPEKEDYWRDLYPSEEAWHFIQNTKVIQALEEAGDDLTRPRQINHWASFSSKKNRKSFIRVIEADGFAVASAPDSKSEDGQYEIEFFREDVPILSEISQITLELATRAAELRGSHTGWDSWVITDDTTS